MTTSGLFEKSIFTLLKLHTLQIKAKSGFLVSVLKLSYFSKIVLILNKFITQMYFDSEGIQGRQILAILG